MKKKQIKKPKATLINLKVLPADLQIIREKANKFAGKNVSLWLRFAGMNYVPKDKDLA